MPAIAIDHCFLILPRLKIDRLVGRLAAGGLEPTPPRRHLGQGTANLFYTFDNAFLELLWVEDEAAARAPASERIGLVERAAWRETGACPFGVALRTQPPDAPLPFPTWRYVPDPRTGMKATEAAEGDASFRQPFLFRGQRTTAPSAWTDGRAGDRQAKAGFTDVGDWSVRLAAPASPGEALRGLEHLGLLHAGVAPGPELAFTAKRGSGAPGRRFVLPAGDFHDEP